MPDSQTIRRIESILAEGYNLNDLHTVLRDNGFSVGYTRLERLWQQKKQVNANDILGCILGTSTEAPSTHRPPTFENEKYGNRRDPQEVVHPVVKQNNWHKKYDNPPSLFSPVGSDGDIELAEMLSEGARTAFETSGNMLYVLEAFFQQVDLLVGCLSELYVKEISHDELSKESQAQDVPCELRDSGWLYLLVFCDGTKEWHFEYILAGETRDYHFGNYPDCSLSYARRFCLAAHDLLRQHKDPSSLENERELQTRIECVHHKEPDVPIPAWMAQALSDGFKHYYSRRFLHQEQVSLDSALGIDGKKNQEEIDPFTIGTRTLVEKTRELQWYFGLSFATCCEIAEKILRLEMDDQEELPGGIKKDLYHFNQVKLKHICEQESRGVYGSYAGWCERNNKGLCASEPSRNDFLAYLAILDNSLRTLVEESLKDARKKMTN